MRVTEQSKAWLEELERALDGSENGSVAESWRELRIDVRALTPPMSDTFERSLRERIGGSTASDEPERTTPSRQAATWSTFGRALHWASLSNNHRRVAGFAAALSALVVAIVVVGSWPQGGGEGAVREGDAVAGRSAGEPALLSTSANAPAESAPAESAPVESAPVESAPASPSPGRVRELDASVTLASRPDDVQRVADGVARLATSSGGFVRSSQVQTQRTGASEATLDLSLPSSRLAAALAALGRLAPVRAESQSLQDITDSYNAARRGLTDAVATRAALLRALSRASTQGEIESLRRRLSLAGGTIDRAHRALQAISRRADSATVSVTVLGNAGKGSEGLTLRHGLHDAGRVLIVVATVLLIAVVVLLPLALVLAILALAVPTWRRLRRERALTQP